MESAGRLYLQISCFELVILNQLATVMPRSLTCNWPLPLPNNALATGTSLLHRHQLHRIRQFPPRRVVCGWPHPGIAIAYYSILCLFLHCINFSLVDIQFWFLSAPAVHLAVKLPITTCSNSIGLWRRFGHHLDSILHSWSRLLEKLPGVMPWCGGWLHWQQTIDWVVLEVDSSW